MKKIIVILAVVMASCSKESSLNGVYNLIGSYQNGVLIPTEEKKQIEFVSQNTIIGHLGNGSYTDYKIFICDTSYSLNKSNERMIYIDNSVYFKAP